MFLKKLESEHCGLLINWLSGTDPSKRLFNLASKRGKTFHNPLYLFVTLKRFGFDFSDSDINKL